LHCALDLYFPADERINLAVNGHLIEVGCISLQRRRIRLTITLQRRLLVRITNFTRQLRHAMGDVVNNVETRDTLQVQEINGLGLFLTENRDQDIAACHFILAARLHVEYSTLQHTLESKRGLDIVFVVLCQQRRLLFDVLAQCVPQFRDVRIAGAEDLMDLRNIQKRDQQMLHGHEFVALVARALKRFVQTEFQFTTQHSIFLSGLFHGAKQGMLLLLRDTHNLCNPGFGNLKTKYAADAFALRMYF